MDWFSFRSIIIYASKISTKPKNSVDHHLSRARLLIVGRHGIRFIKLFGQLFLSPIIQFEKMPGQLFLSILFVEPKNTMFVRKQSEFLSRMFSRK
mmetsp:Transcript_5914/g.12640  ORF Transcript_5914/g.12640 Transcript_5914/m.12640 type:complete len:95 (-) Transcript_5914:143-427(-)